MGGEIESFGGADLVGWGESLSGFCRLNLVSVMGRY